VGGEGRGRSPGADPEGAGLPDGRAACPSGGAEGPPDPGAGASGRAAFPDSRASGRKEKSGLGSQQGCQIFLGAKYQNQKKYTK
jgi:hypothetical protein